MNFTDRLTLRAPASKAALRRLLKVRHIPDYYVDFLNKSNGAEGFVGTVPLFLLRAEEIDEINIAAAIDEFVPGLVIFGSDLSGISYAFDTRQEHAPIVEFFDADIGDGEEQFCANSISDFFQYLSEQK
jgi:SMI1/KNR4 family protein SUKH-1